MQSKILKDSRTILPFLKLFQIRQKLPSLIASNKNFSTQKIIFDCLRWFYLSGLKSVDVLVWKACRPQKPTVWSDFRPFFSHKSNKVLTKNTATIQHQQQRKQKLESSVTDYTQYTTKASFCTRAALIYFSLLSAGW